MKKTILFVTLLLTLLLSAGVSAETLSPALDIIAAENEMTVSALSGEDVTFNRADFEKAAGSDAFTSVTIASLPDAEDGVLYLGDAAVCAGMKIGSDDLEKLRFEPTENSDGASFCFTFDTFYTMTCSIVISDRGNDAPVIAADAAVTTFTKTQYSGCLRAYDPDGDSLRFELVDYPERGSVSFDPDTGEYSYTPAAKTGSDSFTYRARDAYGAYSGTSSVNITVTRNTSSIDFEDMKGSGAAAAAVSMCDDGLMTFSEENGKQYFSPGEEVSRLDFLVTAMNVFGASGIPKIENTGFYDDSEIPADYKGYVYSAAKLGIISGIEKDGKNCFMPDRAVTKAEASVILNSIIGHRPSCGINCSDEVPEWATEAVSAMYELGIYDLDGGQAKAASALVREDAAQMLFSLAGLLGE